MIKIYDTKLRQKVEFQPKEPGKISMYVCGPTVYNRIHIGNAVCVLCGLILGPAYGFFAAGVGNAIFDIIGGYGMEFVITFINKGAIALVTGLIAYKAAGKETLEGRDHARVIVGSILGALTGAIITERVYVVPGAGNLLTTAINTYDNAVIVGVTLFYAVLSVVSVILGDILMSMVDPRISFTSKAR